jgi:hypothetical protein
MLLIWQPQSPAQPRRAACGPTHRLEGVLDLVEGQREGLHHLLGLRRHCLLRLHLRLGQRPIIRLPTHTASPINTTKHVIEAESCARRTWRKMTVNFDPASSGCCATRIRNFSKALLRVSTNPVLS